MRPPVDFVCWMLLLYFVLVFIFISFNFPKITEYIYIVRLFCRFNEKNKFGTVTESSQEELEWILWIFDSLFVSLRKTLFINFYAVFVGICFILNFKVISHKTKKTVISFFFGCCLLMLDKIKKIAWILEWECSNIQKRRKKKQKQNEIEWEWIKKRERNHKTKSCTYFWWTLLRLGASVLLICLLYESFCLSWSKWDSCWNKRYIFFYVHCFCDTEKNVCECIWCH